MSNLIKNTTKLLTVAGYIKTYDSTIIEGAQVNFIASNTNTYCKIALQDIKSIINEDSIEYEKMFKQFANHIAKVVKDEEVYSYIVALLNKDNEKINSLEEECATIESDVANQLVLIAQQDDEIGTVAKIVHYNYFEEKGAKPSCEIKIKSYKEFASEINSTLQ